MSSVFNQVPGSRAPKIGTGSVKHEIARPGENGAIQKKGQRREVRNKHPQLRALKPGKSCFVPVRKSSASTMICHLRAQGFLKGDLVCRARTVNGVPGTKVWWLD